MPQSLRYSYGVLRIGLCIVFLWFGLDALIHPQYWLALWIPSYAQGGLNALHVSVRDGMNLLGIVEVLIGLSLLTGFFVRFFAVVGAIMLGTIFLVHGLHVALVWHLGIVGALISLSLWPERSYI